MMRAMGLRIVFATDVRILRLGAIIAISRFGLLSDTSGEQIYERTGRLIEKLA
jgi:hypothetical protein